MKKHRITRYMVLSPSGRLSFGWRCRCGVPSRRFWLEVNREGDIRIYKGNHKALRS
jgi:hypothetical protein